MLKRGILMQSRLLRSPPLSEVRRSWYLDLDSERETYALGAQKDGGLASDRHARSVHYLRYA